MATPGRSSGIRHRNQLTAKAWEKAVEELGKLGIRYLAAMLRDVVRRRRWAHALVIHVASHVDHGKRVAWVPISIHAYVLFL